MSKKAYKQLQKKLQDSYFNKKGEYGISGSVGDWLKQSSIKPTKEHLTIVFNIFGSVPYPYQREDRSTIIKYLKKNKYKAYCKDKVEARLKKHKKEQKAIVKAREKQYNKAKKEGRMSV